MSLRQKLLDTFLLPKSFRHWATKGPHRADFICPQAFGRNTYPDDSRLLRVRNWLRELFGGGEIIDVSIVRIARNELGSDFETFECLKLKKFDPGHPNTMLATLCFDFKQMRNLPIIGQWEVMYALYCSHSLWYQENRRKLFVIWPPSEGYLTTHGLLLEAREIALAHGWKVPLLVAHPEHIQRCLFLARKIFRTTPAISTGTISDNWVGNWFDSWFDKGSAQRWTRNRWYWLFYELFLARPHHRLKGWI